MSTFGAWHPAGECPTCGGPIWAKHVDDTTPPDTRRTCTHGVEPEVGKGLPAEVRLAILGTPPAARAQMTQVATDLINAGMNPNEVAQRIAVGEEPPDV